MTSLVGNGKYFKFNFLVQSEANEDSQEQVYYGRVSRNSNNTSSCILYTLELLNRLLRYTMK